MFIFVAMWKNTVLEVFPNCRVRLALPLLCEENPAKTPLITWVAGFSFVETVLIWSNTFSEMSENAAPESMRDKKWYPSRIIGVDIGQVESSEYDEFAAFIESEIELEFAWNRNLMWNSNGVQVELVWN